MWYLYLDESGDLGFDFVSRKPSRFFTITILALSTIETNRVLIKAVERTLKNKFTRGKNVELKGTKTPFAIKKYFYEQVSDLHFAIYSMSLNKRRVYEELTRNKTRVYNFIARQVLERIPFERADTRIQLIIDKSKRRPEIEQFNRYIRRQLEARVNPKVPLDIFHWDSKSVRGLQAVDLFCWGIFQKHERDRTEWYDVFKEKIKLDELYL